MHAKVILFWKAVEQKCVPSAVAEVALLAHNGRDDAPFDIYIGTRGVNGSDTLNAFEGLQARAHRGQNDVAERAVHEQL